MLHQPLRMQAHSLALEQRFEPCSCSAAYTAARNHVNRVVFSGLSRLRAFVGNNFARGSIVNLIFPSRKNLDIGLALVNALNLGEFKAVLAHEFGHFAQRTMAVGRWIYIAQQIASHIVSKRDALDTFLNNLSGVDFRIAWVGWVLRTIIWAIRSVIETLFRLMVLAERALSREMEFQADLVSVSVTGSDALINALHKLGAADDAWNRTLAFASDEHKAGRAVEDFFVIQQRIVEKMRTILDDSDYGNSPVATDPGTRLFKAAVAMPPQMWSTHPANSDRENNAKRTYVAASIDERSSWDLFVDPAALRKRASRHMAGKDEFNPVAIDVSLEQLDKEYAKSYLDRRYRGAYLGRSFVRRLRSAEDIFGALPLDPVAEIDSLYPESLAGDVELLRELESEKNLLDALRAGFLTAPGGVIQHRGTGISRKQLPNAIEKVQAEIDAVAQRIWEHDSRCHTAHYAAAKALGSDWAEYLIGLLALHHYAEHTDANLRDAQALLINTVNVALADGKVSSAELQRIMEHATSLQNVLTAVHKSIPEVVPDRTVLLRMQKKSWREAIEELKLSYPDKNNISQWLNAIHSWVASLSNSLTALRWASLEQLLEAETQVSRFVHDEMKPHEAPPASQVPKSYALLLSGQSRPKQTKLNWWDSFQTASGWLPAIARSIAAAVIIGGVMWIGTSVGSTTVYVYNGLGTAVNAQLGEQVVSLAPFSSQAIEVGSVKKLHVRTTTRETKLVEEFDADIVSHAEDDVYNIAAVGVMVSWVAVYGGGYQPREQVLPSQRWFSTEAQVVFKQPPESVSTKGGSATRTVLTGNSGESVQLIFSLLKTDESQRNHVVEQHARWDASSAPYTLEWLAVAATLPMFNEILQQRLQLAPNDVLNLRAEQDFVAASERSAVCQHHTQRAANAPDDADLQYLATRCMDDKQLQSRQFVELQHRWPNNPWIAQAAGYVYGGHMRWKDASTLLGFALERLPALRASLADQLVRFKRAQADDEHLSLAGMKSTSERVAALASLDTNINSKYEHLRGYQWLARGDLQQASVSNNVAPDERSRMTRLIAASDGATNAQVQAATVLPVTQGIDADTYFLALALAAKQNRSTSELMSMLSGIYFHESDQMKQAFNLLPSHASVAEVDAALADVQAESRGHIYAAAVVLWGEQCPRQWRRLAACRT